LIKRLSRGQRDQVMVEPTAGKESECKCEN
jgi:hypothetical protein